MKQNYDSDNVPICVSEGQYFIHLSDEKIEEIKNKSPELYKRLIPIKNEDFEGDNQP